MNNINDISNKTIVRILSITLGFIGLIWVAAHMHRILAWLAISIFLAVAINPAVEFFARYMPRKSRGLSAGLVFMLIIGLFTFLVFALAPPLISQTQELIKKVPDLSGTLENSQLPVAQFARKYNLVSQIKANEARFAEEITKLSGSVLDLAKATLSSFVATLTILVITFFMLLEGPRWIETFRRHQSHGRRQHNDDLMDKMYRAVTGWVTGNLLTSLIAAIATSLVLSLLKVPFSIPLGLLVGLFDLIPLVGATLAAVVVIVVCLFNSLPTALFMSVFFLIYQQIENHVLQPLVYSRTIQLSPLLVMVSAIMGAELGGFLGALISIPVAASLQILIKDYFATRAARKTA
jgi:predicted PurR-regulated permease PerM